MIVEILADFETIQSPRDDSLSQPAADSSLGEGAWTGPQKPPSLREVAREAGRKESTAEQLHGRNKRYSADAGILSDKSEGFAPPLSIVHFPFSIQSNHCP